MSKKKDVHMTGALAALLNSGDVKSVKNSGIFTNELQLNPTSVDLNTSLTGLTSAVLSIHEIDPTRIDRWKHKDRPANELGDINELAETFRSVGKQQPCIVRASKKSPGRFELIIGERRWRAAEVAGLKLKVVMQDLSDKDAALIQAIENQQRSDLSEFAKGMSYADKIDAGILEQKDLTEILGISRQQVSRLLSYKKIPKPLFDAIGDFRLVSARTAEELNRLAVKSDSHLQCLIDLAPKIRTGNFGHKMINKEVNKALSSDDMVLQTNQKVLSPDGRHIFTWRLDNNAIPSIHFPKDIVKLFNDEIIDLNELTKGFKEILSDKLSKLYDVSPRGDTRKN